MIFYLHYILLTSGLSGTSVLLGVFLKAYSDASQGEIGLLLMTFPFASIIVKPLFCSLADRHQAYKMYLIMALIIMLIGYAPFVIIPFFPQFYTNHPRASWYLLATLSQVGNGGLGVAWSLGDSLAVNMAQRSKTPYSRMRLMGTVSWGIYGYIIGQINEMPSLPNFVPAFFILISSVTVEIVVLAFWNKKDFEMYDSSQEAQPVDVKTNDNIDGALPNLCIADIDSTPSSLCGSLRINQTTGKTLRETVFSSQSIGAEDLTKILKTLEAEQQNADQLKKLATSTTTTCLKSQSTADCEKNQSKEEGKDKKAPQVLIFKMILSEDGRLLKYLILFIIFGLLLAPMNFVFLSLDDVCKERGCNFSNLAGSVLISQAAIETISFLVLPWILARVSRSLALAFGLVILIARFFFYSTYFYTAGISPYWALIGEWGHGISYGIFCTILADVALMFANQSKLFIPELRRLGFLSDTKTNDKEKIQAEEYAITMALRATMQAVFGGFMDGLGSGTGSLLCGIIAEAYSYVKLWQIFTIISVVSLIFHQFVELTNCRWSDTYKEKKSNLVTVNNVEQIAEQTKCQQKAVVAC